MLDQDISRFVRVCILTLGIEGKVKVRIRQRRVTHPDWPGQSLAGWQQLDDGTHTIEVLQTKNVRGGTLALLAHELCHAWVDENHPKAKPHGRTFQRTAAGLRRALRDWGYNVSLLYVKGLDK